MKLRIAIFAVIACFAVLLIADTTVNATHSWGSYHWSRSSNPFTLELGNNLDNNWQSYMATSISDWNQSSVLNLVATSGGTSPRQCKITSGRVEVCNDSYGNTGWLGVAGISASGSHITGAYVKLNDTYYNTAQYNTVAWRNLVMCQEIGHAFGLDHQDEIFDNPNLGTCMDYTNNPGSNQHPNTHDYQHLVTMYTHLDSGGGDPPPCRGRGCNGNGANIDMGNPREWGEVIERDNSGRAILYVRDFGNGNKHFTHIYPVPGS